MVERNSGTLPRLWGTSFALLVLNSGSKRLSLSFSGYLSLYLHIATFFARVNLFVIEAARVIVLRLSL